MRRERPFMQITRNMSRPMQVLYGMTGLAMIAAPLVFAMQRSVSIFLPVLGVLTIIQAAVGY